MFLLLLAGPERHPQPVFIDEAGAKGLPYERDRHPLYSPHCSLSHCRKRVGGGRPRVVG
jgi:hypothetical protein